MCTEEGEVAKPGEELGVFWSDFRNSVSFSACIL